MRTEVRLAWIVARGVHKTFTVQATGDESRGHKILVLLGAVDTALYRGLRKVRVPKVEDLISIGNFTG